MCHTNYQIMTEVSKAERTVVSLTNKWEIPFDVEHPSALVQLVDYK